MWPNAEDRCFFLTHSLKYFYTGVSGDINFPEFTVVGMVDDVQFMYFDSNTQTAVPKVEWMKREGPKYWKRKEVLTQDLKVHGLVHRPFDAVKLSCPLSRKTPPKHNVSTSMFDGGDGVLWVIGSIPPPRNTVS
uniref:MHC class I-like antigen recognition-like domain-containing protein n=1 Tax=Esox lucius TaxID=8010 RepID=A0AAY5L455_ESOLU